jgi:tungstate transport system ATP-binding protein
LVFQDPLLLKRTVFENVAAGLKFRGIPGHEVEELCMLWLERLGIGHLRDRSAQQISGGEAQRASLARALVLDPELLMLDEPFNALDTPTRSRLIEDVQILLSETGITTICVTHDMNEALFLGDRVLVMLSGQIRQLGPPDQVFSAPADPEVAEFVGVETVIPGIAKATHDGLVQVETEKFTFECVGSVEPGRPVLLCLRPEDIVIWTQADLPKTSARNRLSGEIARMVPQGALIKIVCDAGFPFVALITQASADEMNLRPGQTIWASFKASVGHLILR